MLQKIAIDVHCRILIEVYFRVADIKRVRRTSAILKNLLIIKKIKFWKCTFLVLLSHLYRASCYYQSFLLPTDAQEICFQRSIKIYIKTTIAPTCFSVITVIRECTM